MKSHDVSKKEISEALRVQKAHVNKLYEKLLARANKILQNGNRKSSKSKPKL